MENRSIIQRTVAATLVVAMAVQSTAMAQDTSQAQKFVEQHSPRAAVKVELSGYRDALIAMDDRLAESVQSIQDHRNSLTSNSKQRKLVYLTGAGLGVAALAVYFKSLRLGAAASAVALAAQTALSVTNLINDRRVHPNEVSEAIAEFERHAALAQSSGQLSPLETEKLGEIRKYLLSLRDLPSVPSQRAHPEDSWIQISAMVFSAVTMLLAIRIRGQGGIGLASASLIFGGGMQAVGMAGQSQEVLADKMSDAKLDELVSKIEEVRLALQKRVEALNAELAK